jgi:twinkle protein
MTSSKTILSHAPCSSCGSSDALALYDDGHSYCFSCHAYTPPENKVVEDFTYEYLPWRGIDKSTMTFYDVKTKIDQEGKPVALGFKYSNGAVKIRLLEKKAFYTEKSVYGDEISKAGLFGRNKFAAGGHRYVVITEGEVDALSLYQVLRIPVVSVQSSSSAVRDCTADYDFLNSFERIYLAFDSDATGREASRSVAKLFDYNKVYHVKFSNRKDANEYLQAGEDIELRNIWENSKRYLPDTIVSSFSDFRDILKASPPRQGVPYPFKGLNEKLLGIRTGETVLFTAMEKVGKTELMHHIEYQLLKETEANVAAIYLEEPKDRHLRALAGISLRKPVHLSNVVCEDGEIERAIEETVGQDERLHLYSFFGSIDPDSLLDTIRFLVSGRGCRYVILDHLSMVVAGIAGDDERRQLDYLSTKLEMLVKELDFALIMVCHVNDQGLTRGSRMPTKVADVTITAMRDLQHPDPLERRAVYLRVLFNRPCWKTGPAGKLIYDPETCSYTEEDFSDDETGPTQNFSSAGSSSFNGGWSQSSKQSAFAA